MAWAVDSLGSPTAGVFDFPSLSLTSYKIVRLELSDITVTSDGTDVGFTFYIGGVEITANYFWSNNSQNSNSSFLNDSASGSAFILLCSNNSGFDTGNAATESFCATVDVHDPTGSAYRRCSYLSNQISPNPHGTFAVGGGGLANTGDIDGFKVKGTSNLVAGKVRVLGLA
jgi:hypothetical protein